LRTWLGKFLAVDFTACARVGRLASAHNTPKPGHAPGMPVSPALMRGGIYNTMEGRQWKW
jgi:hypothetical protein